MATGVDNLGIDSGLGSEIITSGGVDLDEEHLQCPHKSPAGEGVADAHGFAKRVVKTLVKDGILAQVVTPHLEGIGIEMSIRRSRLDSSKPSECCANHRMAFEALDLEPGKTHSEVDSLKQHKKTKYQSPSRGVSALTDPTPSKKREVMFIAPGEYSKQNVESLEAKVGQDKEKLAYLTTALTVVTRALESIKTGLEYKNVEPGEHFKIPPSSLDIFEMIAAQKAPTKVKDLHSGAQGQTSLWKQEDGSLIVMKQGLHPEKRFMEDIALLRHMGSERLLQPVALADDLLITPFVTHGDLITVLDSLEEDAVTAEFVSGVVGSMIEAVKELHDVDEMHGDIKPDQVLIKDNKTGESVLGDLGLTRKTALTVRTGTPGYLPPELCEKGTVYTQKADIYTLGLLIFFLLTGVEPQDFYVNENDLLLPKYKDLGGIDFPNKEPGELLRLIDDCETYEALGVKDLIEKRDPTGKLRAMMKKAVAYKKEGRPTIDELLADFNTSSSRRPIRGSRVARLAAIYEGGSQ